MLSEGYFVAKYKTFPWRVALCFHFANVSVFFYFYAHSSQSQGGSERKPRFIQVKEK